MADFGTLIGADWSIDRTTKKIAYIGADHGASGETYATVIDFHRWLQSLAYDQIAVGDDELDITNTDPSRRSTDNIITLINGYTLEETGGTPASEHLYDGSIIEDDGNRILDGIVNFGNADVVIQILQNGGIIADDWWNLTGPVGVNADTNQGISHRFMVKTREDGVDIDGRRLIGLTRRMDTGAAPGTDHYTFGEFRINGTSRGNNVLALTNADDLNNSTDETTIAGWTDVAVNPGLNLIDIDADTTPEEYFTKFDTSGTRTQNEYYERAKWLTRDGEATTIFGIPGEAFRGITHNFAYSGAGWDPLTADKGVWGTAVVVSTVAITMTVGEAVHEDTAIPTWKGRVLAVDDTNDTLIIDVTSGTVTTAETFTSQSGTTQTLTVSGTPTVVSGGGEFAVLAADDQGATGNLYIQVTKGTAPPNAGIIYESTLLTNTLTLTSVSTSRTISTPWIGASTGSNIIGAYGIGFETDQVNDGDTLTALDGNQYSRPNLVTNSVGGLTITGDADYVFVAPWDQASPDVGNGLGYDLNNDPVVEKDQLSLSGPVTTDDVATITVQEAIPADTPSFGTIRVTDDNGFERWIPYTAWSGSAFTVDTADANGFGPIGTNNDFAGVNAANGNNVYITYLDRVATSTTHSFQSTYVTDRPLVALVRNGGASPIIQFIAEWSLTSANQTLNAIRTTDA